MKIVHFTNNDYDGAGRAVYALHKGLLELGVDSKLLVYRKKTDDPTVIQVVEGHPIKNVADIIRENMKLLVFIFNKLKWRWFELIWKPKSLFNFNYSFTQVKKLVPLLKSVDFVCYYSVQSFLSPKLINEIYNYTKAPIFWTPMDMEPLTGGCHFHDACQAFERSCGNCPQLERQSKQDISRKNWNEKNVYLRDLPITFVAASDWVKMHIEQSSLHNNKDVEKILLGLNDEIFKPGNKFEIRKELGINIKKKVILFGCFDLKSQRKGGHYLLSALEHLKEHENMESLLLLTFGGNEIGFLPEGLDLEWKHMGMVSDDRQMAKLYQASDIFACPTVDDFGPRVVIEAFLCQTPVLAFNSGVAKDLIREKSQGLLVDMASEEGYYEGLRELVLSSDVSNEGADLMFDQCEQKYQAQQYLYLMSGMLNKGKNSVTAEV